MSLSTKAFPFPVAAVKFHHCPVELFQLEDISGRPFDDCYQRAIHCKRVAVTAAAVPAAAAAVVVAAVAVVVAGKCSTMCKVLLSSLLVLPCSHFFLPRFSPSASSARLWVSSTPSLSRACSAALLAARQIRRRPRAVRMCGPLSTRIHHAFLHHVMCLFDTSCSSCIEFVSLLSSTHSPCVVISSFPSCASWA